MRPSLIQIIQNLEKFINKAKNIICKIFLQPVWTFMCLNKQGIKQPSMMLEVKELFATLTIALEAKITK